MEPRGLETRSSPVPTRMRARHKCETQVGGAFISNRHIYKIVVACNIAKPQCKATGTDWNRLELFLLRLLRLLRSCGPITQQLRPQQLQETIQIDAPHKPPGQPKLRKIILCLKCSSNSLQLHLSIIVVSPSCRPLGHSCTLTSHSHHV